MSDSGTPTPEEQKSVLLEKEVTTDIPVEGQETTPSQNIQEDPVDPTSTRGKAIAFINKAGCYLKIPLLKMLNCTAFFVIIYLLGWFLNAIYANLHFDLASLRDFYLMVIGKQSIDHGVNSIFNSNKGVMPK